MKGRSLQELDEIFERRGIVDCEKDFTFTFSRFYWNLHTSKGLRNKKYTIEIKFTSPVFGSLYGQEYWEVNRTLPLFFSCCIDTKLSFSESIGFFRNLGVTDHAIISLDYGDVPGVEHGEKITELSYNESMENGKIAFICCGDLSDDDKNTTYFDNPFYFNSLIPGKITYIHNRDHIGLTIRGEQGTELEHIKLGYAHAKKKFNIGPMKYPAYQYVSMETNKMIPHFDQFLKAYPYELRREEISMLENFIHGGLIL